MMSDVRVVSPRETVIEVDAHAVPGRPGVVTPELRVLHDGAVDAAGVAASSAVEASGSAGAAASSATAAATSASNAASSATAAASSASAADDAMQAASQAASDADQSRVGAAASALAASAAEQAAVAAQDGLVVAREAAASSASSAATSASEAASSASSAATARSGAEAAAVTATQRASAAASSATAAATSASDAASSATAAQTAAAALQDTGWRNIAELINPGFTVGSKGYMGISRTGDFVTVRGYTTCGPVASSILIETLPLGFRAKTPYAALGVIRSGGQLFTAGSISHAYRLDFSPDIPANWKFLFEFTYRTEDPFPTPAAYPGTPA